MLYTGRELAVVDYRFDVADMLSQKATTTVINVHFNGPVRRSIELYGMQAMSF